MEKRADTSVAFFRYERALDMVRARQLGFSPIFITAAVSILVLMAVIGWEMDQSVNAHNAAPALPSYASSPSSAVQAALAVSATSTDAGTSSPDQLSRLGPAVLSQLQQAYDQMQTSGTYSSSTATAYAQSLAPYLVAGVSYPAFTAADVHTDSDTSYARMMRYRADLRVSLAPLLTNTEPEYEIFAYYVDTKNPAYLDKLRTVAKSYREAASSTAQVIAPKDAVSYHVAILNAMEEFGATLDAMADHADDPYASVALLSGYNKAESDMLTSFNALTTYYKSKLPL